jgi:LDH2 family malate/lactate/ureidoglycolate dehydrogenase
MAGRIRPASLQKFLTTVFVKKGLPILHARAVASQLVSSGLRGTDTHGTVLVKRYVDGINDGSINRSPNMRVLKQSKSTALLDGDFGAGQFVAGRATVIALRKATTSGIGAVAAIKVQHLGTLAHYAQMIAAKKMAGILFTNSSAWAAPPGRAKQTFGTNPVCFVFPFREFPIVLDMATSAVAGMKIFLMSKEDKSLPEGWALDKDGRPTTDPKVALEGILLPFGGYKGYGLMLMSELYAALLGGGQVSYEISPKEAQGGFYVQAVDIGRFRDFDDYSKELEKLVRTIRSGPLVKGYKEVLLPGELEARTAKERAKKGIPVNGDDWSYLEKLAGQLRVRLPEFL